MTNTQTDQLNREDRLAAALASCLEAIDNGAPLDRAALVARYPEFASEIARFLDDQKQVECRAAPLRRIAGVAPAAQPGEIVSANKELGDFRIVREVGRGGMGIVYEAIQQSLGRRVALKVLPFAATMDERHLQRFSNEAKAAACLHHTNIVPVFFVGCERGVHFYAMQFIDGQPLSEIIRQIQRREKKDQPQDGEKTVAYQPSVEESLATPVPAAELTPWTGEGPRSRDYYRKVAELGIQAAEALDHAHQLGIVHRDIKPANLLVDGIGRLWVTDFGLAHIQHSEASLTMTGQALGTPRYMSPEQALAKRVPIDHRTDVYSLGVTLYEMLTLRPAFASEDRHELLRQIGSEEPVRPRRVDRAIPAELEIIVLKAMEKRPQDRYATAQELADDLERWLKHEPIRARRPTWIQVARKWAHRHQSAVRAASVPLFVLFVLGLSFALWLVKNRAEAETEARAALQEAQRWQKDERWSEALSVVRRAQTALRSFGSDASLRQQADDLAKDLKMAQQLEEAQLQYTAVKDGHFDTQRTVDAYKEAFAWYGLDVEGGEAVAAGEFIHARSIRKQLVAALHYWASFYLPTLAQERAHLLAVARAADPDEWRDRLWDAWERGDGKVMNALLSSADTAKLPLVMRNLVSKKSFPEDVSSARVAILLRRAQQEHPDDFWINQELALLLLHSEPPQVEQAIRYFMIAVALRPQSPGAHFNLGVALVDKGGWDEAIDEFRKAVQLKPDYANAHFALGNALRPKGKFEEAIAEYRKAIQLKPEYFETHNNLGTALHHQGRGDEAIEEYRKAIRLKPDNFEAHHNLGIALKDKGRLDEALDEYREAIRLKPDHFEAHVAVGNFLRNKGQLDEAIAEYRKAIRVKPDYGDAHNNLGVALNQKGRLDESIDEFRRAVRLNKDDSEFHSNLGAALHKQGQLDEAIDEYRTAIRLKPDCVEAYNNLGYALQSKGRPDEAINECRKAIQLKPDFAPAHNNLGLALVDKGLLEEAIAEYRVAIRIQKDYAQARDNLRTALAQRETLTKLSAILAGTAKADNPAEQLNLAWVCQAPYKRLYAAAAQFYLDAFAAQPLLADALNEEHRYNAACAAALAGCGQGKDADKLDAKQRARWRQQALDWLRADLKACRQVMEKSAGKAGPAIAQRMQHWFKDNDFASVRGSESLAKLPEAERKEWQRFWQQVEELRQRATQQPKTASSSRP